MIAKNYIARQDGKWTAAILTPDVCKTSMGPANTTGLIIGQPPTAI